MNELDAMIRSFRRLQGMASRTAELAAPLVEAALKKSADAGHAPDGTPWELTKAGARPLVNASKALTTVAVGALVLTTLRGVEVIHNFGSSRLPRRPLLPDAGAGLPKLVADAVRAGAAQAFAEAVEVAR